jgi:hypothetical protein
MKQIEVVAAIIHDGEGSNYQLPEEDMQMPKAAEQ